MNLSKFQNFTVIIMNDYVKNAVKDLKTLISIPSVQGDPQENMPFGKAVYDALNFFLKTAGDMGF